MMLSLSSKQLRILKVLIGTATIFILLNILSEVKFKKIEADTFKFAHGRWRKFSQDQINNLSNLGRILFLEETPKLIETKLVPYKILLWKFESDLAVRHVPNKLNPMQGCSVQNCLITYNDADIETADIVVFHLQRTKHVKDLPPRKPESSQIWAFLTDESPYNTFLQRTDNDAKCYNNVFNWSMNYRLISDIPVPYGRTVTLKKQADKMNIVEWNKSKKQDVLVAMVMSNCNEKRMKYANELSKHMRVDIYGACGTLKCPGHYYTDCKNTSEYKFYLGFENSDCDEYITEKPWWSGYHKKAIPIVMGGSKFSYDQSLPPKSYIYANDFLSPKELAEYLLYLNSSVEELESFFDWKRNFEALNEHGFFESRSVHYCRICEALNYNSRETKIYHNLDDFLSTQLCH